MLMKKLTLALMLGSTMTLPLMESTTPNSKARQLIDVDCVEFKTFRNEINDKVEELREFKEEQKRIEAEQERLRLEQLRQEELERQAEEERQRQIEANRIYVRYEISFYCSCTYCCDVQTGITASGTYATEGRTIAAPRDIPFGSEVYIEGMGTYIVEDRGGYIEYTTDEYGNNVMRLDVYLDSHEECLERGRFYADGYIDLRSENDD